MTAYNHFRILTKIIEKSDLNDLTAHGDEMINDQQYNERIKFKVVSHNLFNIDENKILFSLMIVGLTENDFV